MAEAKKTGAAVSVPGGTAKAADKKPPKQSAAGLRAFAAVLWLLAIAAEAAAVLVLNGTIYTGENMLVWLIAVLAVDLILVIVGSQLWKKANRIDPASAKNKLKFWLWNNMGVIASVAAFAPFIILLLNNKNTDPKTKRIITAVAAVALVIAGLFSYDLDPPSAESIAEANAQVEDIGDVVYWTRFGKKYHIDEDCSSISRSEIKFPGTVSEAFEAKRIDLCKICANKHNILISSP
jgi:hypothetical protein